ncbi:Hint domain-containing protein [Tellurirhabdus rosea]|uniref:Hint domain-containing protein n=1 Tax=Tellurirhabdus rosea TaxID=2674997 RepID=UPI00225530BE|nr:Hint domain-containing protein [Tellurirhabdus rosea]
MKKILFAAMFALASLIATAQEAKRGITAAEYALAKAVTFKNVEKDTYVKANGLLFDRDDEKAPYVFKFSDGIERRVYFFSLYEAQSMKSLGQLAVFYTPKDGKMQKVCVPNAEADRAVWGQYIDDLKDANKAADGFAVCLAFALSKESSGPVKTDGATAEKDHNEFCFAGSSYVLMADGTEKPIGQVKVGEQVGGLKSETVLAVNAHQGSFTLTRILLEPAQQLWASHVTSSGHVELEATANHPILTAKGRVAAGDLRKGDVVFVEDAATGSYRMATVVFVQDAARVVNQVYSLTTSGGAYVVDGAVVLDK